MNTVGTKLIKDCFTHGVVEKVCNNCFKYCRNLISIITCIPEKASLNK